MRSGRDQSGWVNEGSAGLAWAGLGWPELAAGASLVVHEEGDARLVLRVSRQAALLQHRNHLAVDHPVERAASKAGGCGVSS
jgi:hypothetical protein